MLALPVLRAGSGSCHTIAFEEHGEAVVLLINRHGPRPAGWEPPVDVGRLAVALGEPDIPVALEAAHRLRAAAGSPAGDADAATAVEHLVRAIAANRTALLSLRPIAPELKRAVKNPWRTHGVAVDPAAVLASLPAAEVRSVRLDSALTLTIATDGVLGHPRAEDGALVFTHARKPTARVEGPNDRLAVLADVVGSARLMPDDLGATSLPVSLDAFAAAVARRQHEVDDLLKEGRLLVEAVERLVCTLYGLPDALTELVVASAVTRSGTVVLADD